jgi:hypothetical protein
MIKIEGSAAGSGSISQRHGSADSDPHHNVMDPQHLLQAHRVILSACSPFFKAVLRRNPHQHPLLYLKGVSFRDMQVRPLCVALLPDPARTPGPAQPKKLGRWRKNWTASRPPP